AAAGAIIRPWSTSTCQRFWKSRRLYPRRASRGRITVTDTIASRVTRVIGGSVHALIDAIEDANPEAAMGQSIREVDQAVDEVRAELGRVEAVKHVATSALNKLNSENEALAGNVELAMKKGDEALARAGLA